MAFPTSPSNNQVHKEGNRSFVYDSALGVWDKVKEIDKSLQDFHDNIFTLPDSGDKVNTVGLTLGAGTTIGSDVTYASKTISRIDLFSDIKSGTVNQNGTTATTIACDPFAISCTAGRLYYIQGSQYVSPYRVTGNGSGRTQMCQLLYGTTDRAFVSTTVDNEGQNRLHQALLGRTLAGASTAETPSEIVYAYNGMFTAETTATHYFYTTVSVTNTTMSRARAYNSVSYPHNAMCMEIMP